MESKALIGLFIFGSLITGCDGQSNVRQSEIDRLDREFTVLTDRINANHGEFLMYKFMQEREGRALLLLSDEGFSYVQSPVGPMTVRMTDINAAGQGSRIEIEIGNLSPVLIKKFGLSGDWGQVEENGDPNYSGSESFDVEIEKDLKPNTWNRISFIIDGAKPAALGFVTVDALEAVRLQLTADSRP